MVKFVNAISLLSCLNSVMIVMLFDRERFVVVHLYSTLYVHGYVAPSQNVKFKMQSNLVFFAPQGAMIK